MITLAISGDESALAAAVGEKEQTERNRDKDYWLPLKHELEKYEWSADFHPPTSKAGLREFLKKEQVRHAP